jgi:cyclic beta-1,2-glucan synthetase
MDFESRDRYRHVVERIAKGSRNSETDIAALTVKLAAREKDEVGRHVGHWLVGAGLPRLEAQVGFRPRLSYRITRALRRHPSATYLGLISLLTFLSVLTFLISGATGSVPWQWLVLLGCLVLFPASEIAVGLTNVLITTWLPPWLLPKLDFQNGISAGQRTVVVVPAMLTNADEVASLLDRLEMHYLANADPALSFALLTDFADAPQEEMPGDGALIEQARTHYPVPEGLDLQPAIDVRAAAKRRDSLRQFITRGATSPTSISSAVDLAREFDGLRSASGSAYTADSPSAEAWRQ